MKNQIRKALLSAAATALIIGPGLSACSKPAEQNAAEPSATAPSGTEQPAGEQAAPANDVSTQNAKALVKAMSD